MEKAAEALRERKVPFTVYSPIRGPALRAAGRPPSPMKYFTFFGGAAGIASGFALCIYTVLVWKFTVSGKPVLSLEPFFVIAYELCILLAVLVSFAGLLWKAGIPRRRLPDSYDPRFSSDRWGLEVPWTGEEREDLTRILKAAGAEEIREIG